MKATGMVRRVDELGRVVLPIEMRRTLGIEERDGLEIFVHENLIILRKYEPGCLFCGEQVGTSVFRGRLICHACQTGLTERPVTATTGHEQPFSVVGGSHAAVPDLPATLSDPGALPVARRTARNPGADVVPLTRTVEPARRN